jgi:RNA polymerase-binding protein DksA
MGENWPDGLREKLERTKAELDGRLDRITANVRRSLETDSKERAKQLEDSEVVDALGNEAREELGKISAALLRMNNGEYGLCSDCGTKIAAERLEAYPYASECIDCANMDEKARLRNLR